MYFTLCSTVSLNLDPSRIPKMNIIVYSMIQTSQLAMVSETPPPRAVQNQSDHWLQSFLATTKKGEMVDEN